MSAIFEDAEIIEVERCVLAINLFYINNEGAIALLLPHLRTLSRGIGQITLLLLRNTIKISALRRLKWC